MIIEVNVLHVTEHLGIYLNFPASLESSLSTAQVTNSCTTEAQTSAHSNSFYDLVDGSHNLCKQAQEVVLTPSLKVTSD